MLQETIPLYLACDKVLIIKASVRVTSPVNKFEAWVTRLGGEGTPYRNANENLEPLKADVYTS